MHGTSSAQLNNTENIKSKIPKTRQQIAQELGISYSTFKRWLKKNDINLPSGLVLPADQEIIYQKFFEIKNDWFWTILNDFEQFWTILTKNESFDVRNFTLSIFFAQQTFDSGMIPKPLEKEVGNHI